MVSGRRRTSLVILAVSLLLLVIPAFWSFHASDGKLWIMISGAAGLLAGLYRIWPRPGEDDSETQKLKQELASARAALQEQSESFEKIRTALFTELDMRTRRLDERERDLATRYSRFQEFLEYPMEDQHADKSTGVLQKLTEQDHQVHKLLEAEAERVYEKIRRNGYTVDGRVDALAIRDDALELIKKVARIYKPGSEYPLLETSFEQLARAASRICLHTLVLLEQLPVSVQNHNINTLYGYIRKAVVGYGVYKQASPWLSYLSRGVYAGRLVATTNPAALGAWWVATELGKKGASKLVENVVDRQAVAMLHDMVTIIGVEAAGIYGTGFRQRDPAWVLGTELVELIHHFPTSGESLRSGLQRITRLPLRSEYDRIYLYRCLASHRSAGLHLADSAMLGRDEREGIARELETFFVSHIHGASDANVRKWREGFEQRFDLRLRLDSTEPRGTPPRAAQIQQAVRSLIAFLQSVMNVETAAAELAMKQFRTFAMLSEDQKQTLIQSVSSEAGLGRFDPPELDPAADITRAFLFDLANCAAVVEQPDSDTERLIVETWSYFRFTTKEAETAIGTAWKQKLRWQCNDGTLAEEIPAEAARLFFSSRHGHSSSDEGKLVFAYTGLSRRQAGVTSLPPGTWLFGTEDVVSRERHAWAVAMNAPEERLWNASSPFSVERVGGVLIDDAAISNGKWTVPGEAGSFTGDLVIAGSLRGGRFRTYFRRLIEAGSSLLPTQ